MATEVIYFPDGSTQTVEHPDPKKPEFRQLASFEALGLLTVVLGRTKANTILKDWPLINAYVSNPNVVVNRNSGQFPGFVQDLLDSAAVTPQEVAAIDAGWRTIS